MNRRQFLRSTLGCSAAGLAGSLDLFPLAAQAQTAQDYKALVCVFLFGGNDGNNMVIPADSAGYAGYAAVRGTTSGINIAQSTLLQVQPRSIGTPFGLHPSLAAIHPLFASGQLALLANVGPLTQPTTPSQYAAGVHPESLYSHSDQQSEWQTSNASGASRTGWGGRIADAMGATNGGGFPVITSTAGVTLFVTGAVSSPLAIPPTGSFGLNGFTAGAASQARLAALNALLAIDRGNTFAAAASDITTQAVALSGKVNPILTGTTSTVAPLFDGQTTSIAAQFLAVAKMIEARASLEARRQVFFVSLGGFDTHNNQLTTQADLLGQLAPAMKSFHDATAQLGIADKVTTFTLSDFGRTFQPAAGGGTDHAWGNHHLIVGGAVRGGDFYGQFPTLALGGPSDAEKEGRWIPTTAIDQYGATLATWFGVGATQLPAVFPNLASFPSANLGFV